MSTKQFDATQWQEIDNSISLALSRVPRLTYRQQQVLTAFCDGPTDRVLARRLGVSVFTVRDHIGTIKKVLGLNTRTVMGIVGYLVLRDAQRSKNFDPAPSTQ